MKGIVRSGAVVATLLLLPAGGSGATVPAAGQPAARVAVRAGDPAPVQVLFGSAFGCRLAAPRGGALPPPAEHQFLFSDAGGTALFLHATDALPAPAPFAYVGQEVGGLHLASLCAAVVGVDGTVFFRAALADGRDGIFRSNLSRTETVPVLVTGDTVALRDGPVTVGLLSDVAVDGLGDGVVAFDSLEGTSAILKFPPGAAVPAGAAPVVLIQSGDPLGPTAFMRATTSPGISQGGRVAFTASLDDGSEVVAAIPPGGAPVLVYAPAAPVGQPPVTVAIADPAVNDAGTVAFLSAANGQVRIMRASGGGVMSIATTGSSAPGGGTFREITDLDPDVDPAGQILFGGVRSNGRGGLYLSGPTGMVIVAEEGMTFATPGTLSSVSNRDGNGSASFQADGSVLFAAEGTLTSGLFSRRVGGGLPPAPDLRVEVGAGGVPIGGAPRFASFLENGLPPSGGGPSLAVGPGPYAGAMIFDARVTGGSRGLFLLGRDGGLRTIAQGSSVYQPGAYFDSDSLAYHSMNGQGVIAFVGRDRFDTVHSGPALYYGLVPTPGIASPLDLQRRIGVGDLEPGGGSRTIEALQTPSRVDVDGGLALPVTLSDGATMLIGLRGLPALPGATMFVVVASGDPSPDGGTFTQIFTGSFFLGSSSAPALDGTGRVLFGATTSLGDFALFAAPLLSGGGRDAVRVVGAGDAVPGGGLSPFELQAVEAGPAGRVAFCAAYDDDTDFGLFLREGGATASVAQKFDLVDDLGFVASVPPRFAFLGDGRLAYTLRFFDGSEAIMMRDASAAATGTPGAIVAATGQPAPDGGNYRFFQAGFRPTERLSSDGAASLAFAAGTDAGPQEIVVFGPPPVVNAAPIADAGPDPVIECAAPGGAYVTLDGSRSSDPDGDTLTYHWTGPFGTAEGAQPVVFMPLGIWQVGLTVNDGQVDSPPDSLRVTVRDTIAPTIRVTATPAILWPVNLKLVSASFDVSVSDVCDPQPSVSLTSVAAFERGLPLAPGPWVAGAALGTDDRSLQLRAERGGASDGRTYVITYSVADASGNSATRPATVFVPHDQRR